VFEHSLLECSSPRRTLPLAFVVESALAGLLVLVPMVNIRALTSNELRNAWKVFIPPPPPGPPPSQRQAPRPNAAPHAPSSDKLRAPTTIPDLIVRYVDESSPPPQPDTGVPGGIDFGPVGRGDAATGNLLAGTALPASPPAAATKARLPIRIRQGGQVVAAKAIYQPAPDYPPLARMARIQGTVRLQAVISTDGRVQNLQFLSGHPLLIGAALEAVSRWRYQPTLLNGEPVEVLTEIDVTFKLAE
jgi:protein TonB